MSKLQMNWTFTKSISEKVISDIKEGRCKIVIDCMSEGHAFDLKWITKLHSLLDDLNISRKAVYYLTSNNIYKDGYNLEFDESLQINIKSYDHCEVELYECYCDYFNCEIDLRKKRTKHFMSFNRNEKPHRTKFINFLEDEKLLDKGYVSYEPKELYLDTDFKTYQGEDSETANAYEAVAGSKWFLSGNEFYLDSYINIITETLFFEPSLRLSEKIFKPVVYKQPFILYCAPFALKQFRSLGYKTFAPFIDESYDEIEDNADRLIALNNEVKRLCDLPIEEIHDWYISIEEILLYNLNHFESLLDRIDGEL